MQSTGLYENDVVRDEVGVFEFNFEVLARGDDDAVGVIAQLVFHRFDHEDRHVELGEGLVRFGGFVGTEQGDELARHGDAIEVVFAGAGFAGLRTRPLDHTQDDGGGLVFLPGGRGKLGDGLHGGCGLGLLLDEAGEHSKDLGGIGTSEG